MGKTSDHIVINDVVIVSKYNLYHCQSIGYILMRSLSFIELAVHHPANTKLIGESAI
jgi:hypothetical protein